MRLHNKAIQEIKEIYRQQFREAFSVFPALEMAERYMNLMEIICR
jgi:hypothetical protein